MDSCSFSWERRNHLFVKDDGKWELEFKVCHMEEVYALEEKTIKVCPTQKNGQGSD